MEKTKFSVQNKSLLRVYPLCVRSTRLQGTKNNARQEQHTITTIVWQQWHVYDMPSSRYRRRRFHRRRRNRRAATHGHCNGSCYLNPIHMQGIEHSSCKFIRLRRNPCTYSDENRTKCDWICLNVCVCPPSCRHRLATRRIVCGEFTANSVLEWSSKTGGQCHGFQNFTGKKTIATLKSGTFFIYPLNRANHHIMTNFSLRIAGINGPRWLYWCSTKWSCNHKFELPANFHVIF